MALSLSTAVQLLGYLILLRTFVPGGLGLSSLMVDMIKMALAAIPAALAAQFVMNEGQWAEGPTLLNAAIMGISGIGGALIYGVAATFLGIEELARIKKRLSGRIRRS